MNLPSNDHTRNYTMPTSNYPNNTFFKYISMVNDIFHAVEAVLILFIWKIFELFLRYLAFVSWTQILFTGVNTFYPCLGR